MKFWKFLRNALIVILVLAVGTWALLFRPVDQPASNDPAHVFNYGNIGNAATQGLPYWIWRVMPQVFPEYLPGDQRGWASLGVYWKSGEPLPVGFSQKTLGVIPRVAINCAFCHQNTYRLSATDPAKLAPAGTGARVQPQAFVWFITRAGQDDRFRANTIMPAIKLIYDMPMWERALYRFVLIPATRAVLKIQAQNFAFMDSRPDWGPGRTDPLNPLKYIQMNVMDDGTIGTTDMMAAWNLAEAAPTQQFRPGIRWDGSQTDLFEAVKSSSIGNGLIYKSFPHAFDDLKIMQDFITTVQPPASPFSSSREPTDPYFVDAAQVARGKEIFAADCAKCHEPGGEYFRRPVPMVMLGTDRNRLDAWTLEAVDGFLNYQEDYDWQLEHTWKTPGYIPTGLSGLWLLGPYLHNGSVPTLRDLLEKPADRPSEFYRGSDLIDAENGGYVSTIEGDPYRDGWKYDTTLPGNNNGGHLWGTDLPKADKYALLAYLKTH